MGRFVNEMMNNMEGKMARRDGCVSLALYSGHDSTLVPLASENKDIATMLSIVTSLISTCFMHALYYSTYL